jgi:alkyl hydroperoxide reductase subunit AhpC
MAKVNFPLMSGEARGRIGDIVFSKRYGKSIVRKFTRPRNTNSLGQQVIRHNFKCLNQAWKGSGDMVYTDTTDNKQKVKLWKYDKTQKTYTEVAFEILSDTEKQAWSNKAKKEKGYSGLGRNIFIAVNQKLLSKNNDAVRMP